MRTPKLRITASLAALVLPALALLCAGCLFDTGTQVASGGAQDFPNTVSLGAAASSHISDRTEWDQFSAIPSTLPSFTAADTLVVAPESLYARPKAGAGLGKTGAAAGAALSDTTYWDFSDTASLKVARRIHEQETLLKIKGDTVTYRWDDKARDSLKGNELILESKGADLWKATEKRQTYRYQNLDSAGGFDRAVFTQRLPAYVPAGFKYSVLVMAPGADGDFAGKADNLPIHYAFARTRTNAGAAPDTLEAFDISDADGDGTLWGKGDSGVVAFRQVTPNPPLRASVESVTQTMRAVLFKDESKTYPLSFSEKRVEKDGKVVTYSVKGAREGIDSTFSPGDTVLVFQHVDFPDEAKMVEKTTRFKIVLAAEPKHYADNRLLRYSVEATWRKDTLLATSKLTFIADAPANPQELAISGDLELSADFGNGHTAEATGRFADKLIDVTLTDSRKDGKLRHFRINWDIAGKLLKQVRLD
jgi:hypothetical protein